MYIEKTKKTFRVVQFYQNFFVKIDTILYFSFLNNDKKISMYYLDIWFL